MSEFLPNKNDITKTNNGNTRIVVCAACRHNGIIITGARHYDKLMVATARLIGKELFNPHKAEQGFIDQYNNFISRKDGITIAKASGQKLREPDCHAELFSEDLY